MAHPELEFFILSIVVDGYESLSVFESPYLAEAVNRRPPAFTREQLIESLDEMFRAGDLLVHRRRLPSSPARSELDAALCGARRLFYGLTPQGGARWEAMAQFDWSYYIGGFDSTCEAANQETLGVYMRSAKKPLPTRFRVVRPWRATYWKTLPQGVRCDESPDEPGPRGTLCDLVEDLWLREWHEQRHASVLRNYIPMAPARAEAKPGRLDSVARCRPATLLRLLNHRDAAVQYTAALQLTRDPREEAANRLIEWFLDRKTYFALRVIDRVDHPRKLDALVQAFHDQSWDGAFQSTFQHHLIKAIAAYKDDAVFRISPLLPSAVTGECRAAIECLQRTGSSHAASTIRNWLEEAPRPDWEDHLARTALAALSSGDAQVLADLTSLIRKNTYYTIEGLCAGPLPEARDLLVRFVHSDAATWDRCMAAAALADTDSRFAALRDDLRAKGQAETLAHKTNWLLTGEWNAAAPNPIDRLTALLGHPHPGCRAAALILLYHQAPSFPDAAVAPLLADPEPRVRANAAYALLRRGGARHRTAVAELIRDTDAVVRYCASRRGRKR